MIDDEELSEAYNLGYSCAKDMSRDEITRLRAENEKLRKALKPFAEVLTLRDCGEVVFENIEIEHVYAARKALETDNGRD